MSITDTKTLAVYDSQAAEYGERYPLDGPYPTLETFLDALPAGGRVLDLGCGVGHMAARMRDRGFDVVALDAAPGMATEAARLHGLDVITDSFDALPRLGRFAGIWAHFSLLHADRSDLPRHFDTIARALMPGGRLLVGMKTGTGTARDALGRRYTYVTEDELTGLITAAGMQVAAVEPGASTGFDGTLAPWIKVTAHA